MIAGGQSTHTLDILAVTASALAVATLLLVLVTVILARHVTRGARQSTESLSDVVKTLSKRGVDHAHKVATSRHSHD